MYISSFAVKRGSTTLLANTSGASSSPYNTFFSGVAPANLVPGTPHTLEVSITGSYQTFAGVWIDYNNDGDFLDSGELVWNSTTSVTTGMLTGTFTPATGVGGVRRMRVRSNFSAQATHPTNQYNYGEAEDYLVNLGFAIATPSPLPTGAVNTAYSATISATNGATPYTWQYAANGYVDPNGTAPTGYTYGLPPGITATTVGDELVLTATVYVENVGTANLTLGNVTFQSPTSEFQISAVGFSGSVPVGGTETFTITFNPTTPGTHTAVVQFTHNDAGAGSPFILNVTGEGVLNSPVIEVREETTIGTLVSSGAAVVPGGGRDCGEIDISAGNTPPVVIVVMNTGNQNLVLGNPTLAGANSADFNLNPAGWSNNLAPGANCSFAVTFDPSLGGMKDCQVEFTQDDASQPTPYVVRFRGTAIDPSAVQITTPDLQVGVAGSSYSFQMEAVQGTTPYVWSVYSGSLPAGLSLSADGLINGTPEGFGGSSQVTIRVEDSTSATHERTYTFVVTTGDGGKASSGCVVSSTSGLAAVILGLLAVVLCAARARRRHA